MQIEQVNGQKVNFGLVVGLFAATIVIAAIVAVFLVSWRGKKKNATPYTKHPLSMLVQPLSQASLDV